MSKWEQGAIELSGAVESLQGKQTLGNILSILLNVVEFLLQYVIENERNKK